MNNFQHKKLVKGFAIYHAVAITPFLLPVISELVLALLGRVHVALQLPGQWPVASVSELLFLNLFACVALLWAIVRIKYPSRALGFIEGCGMLLMSAIVIFYVWQGASALWLLIALVDIPGGVWHLLVCKKSQDQGI